MTALRIISRRGSRSRKYITEGTGIYLYKGNKKYKVDAIINYGLAGKHMDALLRKYPSARKIPMLNRHVGYSKLNVVNRAKAKGIKVPESKLTLNRKDNVKDFIEKKFSSIGGIGIKQAKTKRGVSRGYYQRFIEDRHYELRVHTFLWIDDYVVQKRMGPKDQIAWNFKQGGHFITIHNPGRHGTFTNAKEISKDILKILRMSFGAVDFIVDTNYDLWFLEVNSAPGFTELSGPTYLDAFNKLKNMPLKQVLKHT